MTAPNLAPIAIIRAERQKQHGFAIADVLRFAFITGLPTHLYEYPKLGKVPVDAANTLYVPSVTLGDLGLRYRHKLYGKDTTWRLNVSNVGDKDYWSSRSGMLYLGAPRTLSLSATLAF